MPSLFSRTWKTLIHSLVKLFWTFILYIRSLSFKPGEFVPTTPKPRGEKRSVVDLEGGENPCDPRLDASPVTPLTPTPCFRRARASTLYAYTPPNANSSPQRPAVTSRSSGSSLSSTMRSGASRVSGDPIVCGVTTDRRFSEGSLCSFATAPSAPSEDSISVGMTAVNAQQSIVVLEGEETMSTPMNKGLMNFIANHRDSRYVNANRIKGASFRERNPLPFKCLSPLMTLSLGVASSSNLPATTEHRRVSTIADATELRSPAKSGIDISEQDSGSLERSCSLDLGLSLKKQETLAAAQSVKEPVSCRRPRATALSIRERRSRTKGIFFDSHITASLLLASQDKPSLDKSNNPIQGSHVSAKSKSGPGAENGHWDVSFVKRVFSVMRADDGEQDGQDARNIFNRESVWDYRKSTSPFVKPVSRRFSEGIKLEGIDIFEAAIRKSRRRTAKITSIVTGQIEGLTKATTGKRVSRSRHKSAMFGPSPSPSIQYQLRKEMIKRQRKLRQDMVARRLNKSEGSSRKARESYDWLASED